MKIIKVNDTRYRVDDPTMIIHQRILTYIVATSPVGDLFSPIVNSMLYEQLLGRVLTNIMHDKHPMALNFKPNMYPVIDYSNGENNFTITISEINTKDTLAINGLVYSVVKKQTPA